MMIPSEEAYDYNYNTNVIIDIHGNQFTIDDNDDVIPFEDNVDNDDKRS